MDSNVLGVECVSYWRFRFPSSIVCELGYHQSIKGFDRGFELRGADAPAYFEEIRRTPILAIEDALRDQRSRDLQPYLASRQHRRAARHRRPRRRRGRRHPLPRARRRAPTLERAGTAARLRHRPDHRGPHRHARPQPHPGTRTKGGAARGRDDRRGGGVRLVRGRPGRGRSRRAHPGRLLRSRCRRGRRGERHGSRAHPPGGSGPAPEPAPAITRRR